MKKEESNIMENQAMKRIAIYSFFDKQGIVDGYVEYFLDDFVNNVNDMIIVSNGQLEQSQRAKLEK